MQTNVNIIRQAITKVTQMLSGMNVEVTQRGDQAFVKYDTRTGGVIRVNIPYLPDGASDELIAATQGFLDHEVAHILFTDPKAGVEAHAESKRLGITHNIVEDCFIERLMQLRFKGSGVNLGNVRKLVFDTRKRPVVDAMIAAGVSDEVEWFKVLNITMLRAWAGHEECLDFMNDGDKWAHMPNVTKALSFFEHEIGKCKSSWDTLELARKVLEALRDMNQDDAMDQEGGPGDGDDSDSEPGDESGEEGQGESSSTPETDEESEGQSSQASDEEEDQSQGGADEAEADNDGSDQEDGDESDAGSSGDQDNEESSEGSPNGSSDESEEEQEDEGSSGAQDNEDNEDDAEDEGEESGASDSDDSDEDETDESEDGADSSDEDEGSDGDDGESSDDDGDQTDEEGGKTGQDTELYLDAMESSQDFEKELSAEISKVYQDQAKDGEFGKWLVFSRENNEPKPFKLSRHFTDRDLNRMFDSVNNMIGPMAKQLERLILAKKRSIFEPGKRSGRLHAANLHRLKAGDDRVFRRKYEHKLKDTAVEILIDMSGSMYGPKMEIAAHSGYALAQMLQRVNIPCEVFSFSTVHPGGNYAREMDEAEARIGRMFSQQDVCNHLLLKGWNERMTPEVARRFADLGALHQSEHMATNCDPESVETGARRLALREEERKIMMVLSDGHPAFYGDEGAGFNRLKSIVKDIESAGMEVVGIGIEDAAVRNFYPKAVVLNSASDLPKAIMGEMQRMLLK